MSRLPAITAKDLIRALERLGFLIHRIRAVTTLPPPPRWPIDSVHVGEDIGPGLLAKILRDCKLVRKELSEHL